MPTEMLHQEFAPSDPIQILDFLLNFRRSCDSANIHEGAAKWLFPHFMAGNVKQELLRRLEWNHPNNENQGYSRIKS